VKNEIGNTYGYLTVIDKSEEREFGSVCWICKCKCGNITVVAGDSLRSGATKSCGCLIQEKSRKANFIDRTGQQFGKLTVLGIDEEQTTLHGKKGLYWKCQCECGNITTVLGTNLSNGSIKSCGCIKTSYGEELITKLLTEHKINFLREYTVPNLVGDKNVPLRFDFAIFDKNNKLKQLIEYDGEQHFHVVDIWGGEAGLKHRQENDLKKNIYCMTNNIKLVRIPYWKTNNLEFKDLEVDINEFS
jgi:hypothetical protein